MVVFLFLEVIVVFFLIYIIFVIVSYKVNIEIEIISPYECGFDPKSKTRIMFSYKFFLISILFLLFDVEISLILPIPFLVNVVRGILVFYLFILILILGLLYEYYYGSLNWL